VQPDSSFSVPNLAPGEYTFEGGSPTGFIVMMTGVPNTDVQESFSVPLSVAGDDMTGLSITSTRGGTVRGRILFDGAKPPTDVKASSLAILTQAGSSGPRDLTGGRATIRDDWTFDIRGILGKRTVRLSAPGGDWFLKAVEIDGRDVTDSPVDFNATTVLEDVQVVLTQKRTQVQGRALSLRNEPASDYAAIVFPEEPERWHTGSRYIQAGRPDQQGLFTIRGLPPGRYLAAAVDYLESGEERDPDLLKSLVVRSSRLTLGEGEAARIDLRLVER
jgi:hypothetical protein